MVFDDHDGRLHEVPLAAPHEQAARAGRGQHGPAAPVDRAPRARGCPRRRGRRRYQRLGGGVQDDVDEVADERPPVRRSTTSPPSVRGGSRRTGRTHGSSARIGAGGRS